MIKKILITLIILMALAINLSATPIEDEEDLVPISGSLRGASRFLAQHMRGLLKCNKNPRLCRAKGSPGPDCCNKKCVNVKTDKQNCGLCGKKCKNQEICCKGEMRELDDRQKKLWRLQY
ncbi:putative stigma-specific protein Stig1 [Helianthus annuus]|nr:putative stigma-specific protein Stig1 [Helianthus annuus]